MNGRLLAVSLAIVIGLVIGLSSNMIWPYSRGQSTLLNVTGTLEPGVEAGCVILQVDNGDTYLLVGWSNYPAAGSRVTITGYFVTMASYCMQGQATIRVVSLSVSLFSSVTYATITASSATVITGSTAQSSTITGEPVTMSGFVFTVVESPLCYPQCGAPSFLLTYLYIPPGTGCTGSMGCYPPPRYYKLLNFDGTPFEATAPNGTYATVTGLLTTPSSWNCDSFYVPKICMQGDIYVQNISYPSGTRSYASTLPEGSMNTTSVPYTSIAGFDVFSILAGMLLGITILTNRRKRDRGRLD